MKNFATVDSYIHSFPKDIQKILKEIRTAIKKAAPKAEECIAYGMPAYKQPKALVYFAAQKSFIGFYPTPSGIIAFKKEIAKYKSSKGAVQFPLSEKIPLALITKMTKFRLKEELEKMKNK